MAEINTPEKPSSQKGVKKMRKKNSRVDLTAMVDVCFLLIMFFIFTTQLESLSAMDLIMPKDTETRPMPIPESGAFTILLGKDNAAYYYEGLFPGKGDQVRKTSTSEIRQLILDKKKRTDPEKLMVIIKATDDATYKNTVDILDEMTINGISRYAIADISEAEKAAL